MRLPERYDALLRALPAEVQVHDRRQLVARKDCRKLPPDTPDGGGRAITALPCSLRIRPDIDAGRAVHAVVAFNVISAARYDAVR
jgi:hypothetical protein